MWAVEADGQIFGQSLDDADDRGLPPIHVNSPRTADTSADYSVQRGVLSECWNETASVPNDDGHQRRPVAAMKATRRMPGPVKPAAWVPDAGAAAAARGDPAAVRAAVSAPAED